MDTYFPIGEPGMPKRTMSILILQLLAFSLISFSNDSPCWPCFHGDNRDNKSTETGLLQSWPQEGPELIWSASGIGHGFSSVAVADGRIFTAGIIDKNTCLVALDLDGNILWYERNGAPWQASKRQSWAVPYAGSRGTPTIDGSTVYHLSDLGRLTAFDVRTGDERWHLKLIETFDAEASEYGYSESVLIDGDRLFCCPGGKRGYIVALDKSTGKTLWTNTDFLDPIGYSSPVIEEVAGLRQVVTLSANRLFAVSPENGKLLWQYELSNKRGNNATDAIVYKDFVYASSGYGKGSVLLRLEPKSDGTFSVEEVWATELLDNHHGGVILHEGFLYGAGHEARGWFCLDFETGAEKWRSPGKGSLTWADDRLYLVDEKGEMTLVQSTPEQCREFGSFEAPRGGKGPYWAHPVVCGGRLYVRHSDTLFAYSIGE